MNNVCVLGSMNMDMCFFVERMPESGETMLCNDFRKIPGGKGANQAVAAKRLGANVFMIGKIGQDDNGKILLNNLVNDGVDVDYVFIDEEKSTGLAMITVSEKGENFIMVVSGSNMNIRREEVLSAKDIIINSNVILSEFETPIEATIEAFQIARNYNIITLLNPAPAQKIPNSLIELTDIIVPNENEIFLLTGIKVTDIETAKLAADKLIKKGVKYVIITLGEKGAALVSDKRADIIPAHKVNVVDTTAAGDAFIGALASRLCRSLELQYDEMKSAVIFANRVSAMAVQRYGAQPSLPYLQEVIEAYGDV